MGSKYGDDAEIGGDLAVTGSFTFNEDSADVDFRVESNGKTHMLFVDSGNDKFGVGTSTPVTLLTVEGAVTLKEQSAADSDTAAYGQLWVKTATPNELYYTTDAGDDIQLTSGTSAAGGGGGDPDWDDENHIIANLMLGG